MRNARTLTENDNRASADSSETDERDNDEYESDATDAGGKGDSSNVILAFTNSDEEDTNHRPKATSSGRAVTRRSEILTSLSFDLYFLINKQLSALIGFVNIFFIVNTITKRSKEIIENIKLKA